MSDPTYTPTPNGGVIGRSQRPHSAPPVNIRGGGAYVTITQGTDQLLVSEAQLPHVLDAVRRAAEYLKWKEKV